MQDVHLTFPIEHFHAMVAAFAEQVAAQHEAVTILDCGCSSKAFHGYIVLEWEDDVDESFIAQLAADWNVLDFSVYSVSCLTDEQVAPPEHAERAARSQSW
jgi:hypothetical protein